MRTRQGIILAILLLIVSGCGGIRYSELAPEASDFHPRRIALLPADVRTFPDAKGVIDRLFFQALVEKGWFAVVVGGDEIFRRMERDQELRQAVTGYLEKLDKVSFSDNALSGQIGRLTGTEALLLVRVDYWHYSQEQDRKMARVSLSVRLVEAATGRVLWTAGQNRTSEYLLIRPELAGMAEGIIDELIEHMPR